MEKMYLLAFDTTAAQCSVILQQDRRIIDRFTAYMDFGQAEVLIPEIQSILSRNHLAFADIGLLVVCVGPGSFTGVRASISAARAFGLACPELVVAGINAFDAYVLDFKPDECADLNAVIIETKREDFYFQVFDRSLNRLSPPQALPYEEVLSALRHKKVSLTGDGVERFLSAPSGLSLHCIKMPEALPIELLAEAGLRRYEAKRIDFPKPLYLRAPDVSAPKA